MNWILSRIMKGAKLQVITQPLMLLVSFLPVDGPNFHRR